MIAGLEDEFNLYHICMTAVHVDVNYVIHCSLPKSVILRLGNHSKSGQLTSCVFCSSH